MYLLAPFKKPKTNFFWCSLWITLLCFPLLISAQNKQTTVEHISSSEGLSNRATLKIIQDDLGFLWIATANGLNKYDGYDFQVYTNTPNSETHINGTNLQDLQSIANDDIAIKYKYNQASLDILNPRSGEVKQLNLNKENGINGIFKEFYFEEDGAIYVLSASNDSLYMQVYKSGDHFQTLFALPIIGPVSSNECRFIKTKDGLFWIKNSKSNLTIYDQNGNVKNTFKSANFGLNKNLNPTTLPTILYQDKKERIWLAWENQSGLYILNKGENKFKLHPQLPKKHSYQQIWEDKSGNKILSTAKRYEVQNLFCVQPDDSYLDYNYLTAYENKITHFFGRNFLGTFFMSTYSGIKKIIQPEAQMDYYLTQKIDPDKEEWGYAMRGIAADKNEKIYVAREIENWYAINTQTKEIEDIKLLDPESNLPIAFQCSYDIFIDKDQQLWGSSCNSDRSVFHLHQYDLKTKRLQSYPIPLLVRHIIEDRNENIWVLAGEIKNKVVHGQLYKFDKKSKQLEPYLNADGTNPFHEQIGLNLYQSSDDILWGGSMNSLVKIDLDAKTTQTIKDQNNLLTNVSIYTIVANKKGQLYLGTSAGLIIYDPITNKAKSYNKQSGLPDNSIAGIIIDEQENLWLSTFYGISYFDLTTEIFRNFNARDGFSHNEFNRFSFHKGSDGLYYFGGMNGLNAFDPKELLKETDNPPVQLTKVVFYDSQKDSLIEQTNNLHSLKSLNFSPHVSYFQLQFTLPNFEFPTKNQYKVWLEGLEKDWIFLGNTNSIRYNKLPAGDYTLHIRGADSRGNWNQKSVKVKISVSEYFYNKTWFPFLFIIPIFLIGYLIYRNQLLQLKRMDLLRTKIASDLHDEIGSIMTRISMGSEMLSAGIYKPEEQKKELNHIANQSRKVTSIMRDVVWSIDARKDKIIDLTDRMREHLEELLPIANINYKINLVNINPEKKVDVNFRQEIYFIFKEAINNTVKHSNATEIKVYLENTRSEFRMKIKDNGTSENTNGKSSSGGQGLKNIRMRAKRLKGVVKINKDNGYEIILKRKPLW